MNKPKKPLGQLYTQCIQDPIYGAIPFTDAEKAIIDSPLFQRLRFVGQLTGASQVFPGGVHTRFAHSLGAMHVAGLYATHLSSFINNDKDKDTLIRVARIAALLHDIGHGPFSHAYDHTVYRLIYTEVEDGGHDLHRLKMVESPLLEPLLIASGISAQDLQLVWNKTANITNTSTNTLLKIISHIVQGPIGADRIDFTLRDSYFTGTRHFGDVAYQRIINSSQLISNVDNDTTVYKLVYNEKCFDDIQQALDGRFYMYKGVYLHKTCHATEVLLELMMENCDPNILVSQTENLHEFKDLHDISLIGRILTWPIKYSAARYYWDAISRRDLPKMIWEELVNIKDLKLTAYTLPAAVKEYVERTRGSVNEKGLRWTRIFGGMNLKKFDDLEIGLIDKKGTVLTFSSHQRSAFKKSAQNDDKKYIIIREFEIKTFTP